MKKKLKYFKLNRFGFGLVLMMFSFHLSGQMSIISDCLPGPMERQEGNRICIPIKVKDFTRIGAIQLKFNYNQLIFKPDTILAPSYNPFNIGPGIFNINEPGEIRILSIINDLVDFKPNDTLFVLCGRLTGSPGNVLSIQPDRNFIDILQSGRIIEGKNINFNLCPIEITPKDNAVTVVLKICGLSSSTTNDGSINVRGTGGEGPYNFSISLNSVVLHSGLIERDTTIKNLGAGNYVITITDRKGNTDTKSRNIINERVSLKDFIIGPGSNGVINPLCPAGVVGTNHQSGRISVTGRKPLQYDFTWSNNLFNQGNSTSISGLEAGSYTLTITEPNTGCSVDTTFVLVAPNFKVGPLEVIERFTCFDSSMEATIKIPVSGGTGDYRYRTTNLANQNSAARSLDNSGIIPPGRIFPDTKSISIIDRNNCEFRLPLFDTLGRNIIGRDTYALNIDSILLNCFSDTTANTVLRVLNTTGQRRDLRIQSITNLTTNEIDQLGNPKKPETDLRPFKVGDYLIKTATFDNRCIQNFKFKIAKPTEVKHNLTVKQPSCSDTIGSIAVNSSGGASPFIYKWKHDTMRTSPRLDSISRGTYRITARDENNCKVLDSTIVIVPSKLIKLDSIRVIKNIECGKPGTISAFSSIPEATLSWNTGSTSSTINPTTPGKYTVTLKSGSCSIKDSINITETSNINVILVNKIDAQCRYGINSRNGSVQIGNITGGRGQVSRSWFKEGQQAEIAQNVNVVNNLSAGRYRLKLTDEAGCIKEEYFDIGFSIDTVKVRINRDSLTTIKCKGRNNGQAVAIPSGGTGNDYVVRWSSGSIGNKVSNLQAGRNWVVASNRGCFSDTAFFNIMEESSIEIVKNINNPSCPQARDGKAAIQISGNIDDYDIIWINQNKTGPNIDSLTLGSYSFAIRNKNDVNCVIIDSIKINESGEFKIGIDSSITRLSGCGGGNSGGQVGFRLIRGAGPVDYIINGNPLSGNIARGLASGSYNFIGVNNKGCRDTIKNFVLVQNQPVSARLAQIDSIKCNGGKTCIRLTDVKGGSGKNYTWAVNFSKNLPIDSCFEAFAGKYRINVFDSEGCSDSLSVTIGQPDKFQIDMGQDIVYQLGGQKPIINITSSPGSNIVNVKWSNPSLIDCKTTNCQQVEVNQYTNVELIADAVNQNGCIARGTIKLILNEKENVFIPSVLRSDNNVSDFDNTRWKIILGDGVETIKTLKILDRWGNVVFAAENIDNNFEGWDGKFNGTDLPSGVYAYFAEIQFVKVGDTAKINTYSGSITLIR